MTMTEKGTKEKTKVLSGIIILILYYVLIQGVIKLNILPDNSNFDYWDSLLRSISLPIILAMILYTAIVKLFHFNTIRKGILFTILFILLNVCGYYYWQYSYSTSPTVYQTNAFFDRMKGMEYKKQQSQIDILNKSIISFSNYLKDLPRDVKQIKNHIQIVDTVLILYKAYYDLTSQAQNTMMKAFSEITSDNARKNIIGLLKNRGIKMSLNSDSLAAIRIQNAKWFRALTLNFEARKTYYQSCLENESVATRDSLFKKWSTLENDWLREESILIALQSTFKGQNKDK
jgi:hypothetical protein